jgi:hypothetical protein
MAELITLPRAALEQPEPCTYRCEAWPKCGCAGLEQPELRELLISAAAMAVAAERKGVYQGASWVADAVLEQPKQEQPEQEPVACLVRNRSVRTPARIAADCIDRMGDWSEWKEATLSYGLAVTDPTRNYPQGDCQYEMRLLYTHPPRQPWKKLSEGHLMGLYIDFDRKADKQWSNAEYLFRLMDTVQTRLKELNT